MLECGDGWCTLQCGHVPNIKQWDWLETGVWCTGPSRLPGSSIITHIQYYSTTVLLYYCTTVHAATAHKNYISTCLEWHYETWHFIYCAWLESHSQKWSCQNQTQDVLSIGYTRPGTGLSSKVSEDHHSSYIGYKKQLYFAACAIKIVSHTSVFWELLATCKTAKLAQHNLNKNNAIITTMTIPVHYY